MTSVNNNPIEFTKPPTTPLVYNNAPPKSVVYSKAPPTKSVVSAKNLAVRKKKDAKSAAAAANKLISVNPLDKAELTAMVVNGLRTSYYISNKLNRIYNNINTHITDRAIVKTITNPQEGFLSDIDGAKINPYVLLSSNPNIFTTNPMEPININLLIHSLLDRICSIYGAVPIIRSVMSMENYKKILVDNLTKMFIYYFTIMHTPQQNIEQTKFLAFIFNNFIDYIKASVRDFAERQDTATQATPIGKYLPKKLCYLCGRIIDRFNLEHKDNIIHAVLFAGLVQRVSRKGGNVVCGKYSEATLHKLLSEYASACAECNAKKSERNYTEYEPSEDRFIINHNYSDDMTALNKHTKDEGFLHLSLLADIKNIVMYDLQNSFSALTKRNNVLSYTLYCAFCFVNLFKNLPLPIVILMYHNVTIIPIENLVKIQPVNYTEGLNASQMESELSETENVGNAAVAVTAATAMPTTLPTAAATALPTTLPTAVPTAYVVYSSYSPSLQAMITSANITAEEIIKTECTTSTPNSSLAAAAPAGSAAVSADAAAPGGGGLHTRRHYKKIKKVKSKKQHNRRKHTTKRVSKIRKTHKRY